MLWSIFERVRSALDARGLVSYADVFSRVALKLREITHPPFEFVVVDEAQDVSVPQLRFLAALGAGRPNSLFFAGDLGQRIFQQPFSWKALGVDVRGRSSTLRINYRTSHQIRAQADRLLGPEVSDVDGNKEERKGTISTFNGPAPDIMVLDTPEEEISAVSQWLAERIIKEASCRTKSASSSALLLYSTALVRRLRRRSSRTKCSMTTLRPPLAVLRSARCIWPRALNSAQWWSWLVTTR